MQSVSGPEKATIGQLGRDDPEVRSMPAHPAADACRLNPELVGQLFGGDAVDELCCVFHCVSPHCHVDGYEDSERNFLARKWRGNGGRVAEKGRLIALSGGISGGNSAVQSRASSPASARNLNASSFERGGRFLARMRMVLG